MNLNELDKKTNSLLFNLWFLTGHFNALLSSCCENECNLTNQEIRAIEFLGKNGPSKMKTLSEHLRLAVSSTTSLVDNLENKGEVKRERSKEDRRVILLQLTKEGVHNYQIALQAYNQFCRNILRALDVDEQDNLIALLDKIRKAVDQ